VTTARGMARADVEDICVARWPDEATARSQAAQIEEDGWRVEHHFPALGGMLGRRVAEVYDPDTDMYVGAVWAPGLECQIKDESEQPAPGRS
jgi:hypothetical protein